MRYSNYEVEEFVQDEYFQKWVLDPDPMTEVFWNRWIADHPEKEETVLKAKKLLLLLNYDENKLSNAEFGEMWQNIIERRGDANAARSVGYSFILKVAASLVFFLSVGIGVYLMRERKQESAVAEYRTVTLEFEDGTIRELDEESLFQIGHRDGDVAIVKDRKTLKYQSNEDKAEEVQYNRLMVPYGKTFTVILSDSTKVMLNSGSSLRYPVAFLADQPREVFLEGEAFFQVRRDASRTFTVMTDRMNTQVYGTSFNVTSYGNENITSAVLVEGSVGIYERTGNQKPIMIVPGQRAVMSETEILVEYVDIDKFTAWTTGRLVFNDDPFEYILKRLERHFDVKIENEFVQNGTKRYSGTFEEESLPEILNVFQAHTPFSYRMEGDKVTIYEMKE